MFGHQHKPSDDNKIPEKSIDGALKSINGISGSDRIDVSDRVKWHKPETPAVPQHKPVPQQPKSSNVDYLNFIKSKALHELTPLVDNLEQSPEEKFRTTMMLIQASDDRSLIPKAYELAKKIQNKNKRAQALLDVVNEINYFSDNQ